MTIKHLGDNKYLIRETILIHGKKKELKFCGEFKKEKFALDKSKCMRSDLEKMKAHAIYTKMNPYSTWKWILNEYFDSPRTRNRLGLETRITRKYAIQKHTSVFLEHSIDELSTQLWQGFFDELDVSHNLKKEIKKYVNGVYVYLKSKGDLAHNHIDGVYLEKDKSKKTKASSLSAMTKEEIVKLLNYFKHANKEWYQIFYVTYQLGLRSSEAQALCFEDIDWENNNVIISRSLEKSTKEFKPPKNGNSRIVPMNETLKEYLLNAEHFPNRSGFVLPRNKAWARGRATEYIQQAQELLEIKSTNYHSLRASFITHLLKSGMSIISVQAMVGHEELKTTQKYIRLAGSDLIGGTDAIKIDF